MTSDKRIYLPKNARKVDTDAVVLPWANHLWASWHGCDGGSTRVHWCKRCGKSWGHNAWGESNKNCKGLDVFLWLYYRMWCLKCFNITFCLCILFSWLVKILTDMQYYVCVRLNTMSQEFKLPHLSLNLYYSILFPPGQVDSIYWFLPGAGELITGPTVLGDVMAAGNLICASPPYLITTTTEELLLVCVQCKCKSVCI